MLLLENSAVETVKFMHEAYTDEERLGDSTIFHWHTAFSKGRETIALLPHVGQSLSICTEEMVNTFAAIVRENRHITHLQLAQALDFKIICSYDSASEVGNVESRSLLGSSFPDLSIERPLY